MKIESLSPGWWKVSTTENLPDLPGLKSTGVYMSNIKTYKCADDILAALVQRGADPTLLKLLLKTDYVSSNKIIPEWDLREYQRIGVSRVLGMLQRYNGAILADDMGLGKTRQAVAVAKILNLPTLVVCPAKVREGWEREAVGMDWRGPITTLLPNGKSKRVQDTTDAKPQGPALSICSYEALERVASSSFSPALVIFDEVHNLSGRGSSRSSWAQSIANLATYRLGLSGTPMSDRPRDLAKVLNILLPGRFNPPSLFDATYCAGGLDDLGHWNAKGVSNAEELKLRLSFYMVRREKKDVASELPTLTRLTRWVDGSKQAADAFTRLLTFKTQAGFSAARDATLKAKIPLAVEEALAVQDGKFLVATWRKEDAREIHKQLIRATIAAPTGPVSPGPILLTGDMPASKRHGALEFLKERSFSGIVATADAIGEGFDGLQYFAHTGIVHSVDPRPRVALQLEKRLDRIGQSDPVTWIYLAMRDSVDELLLRNVVEKLDNLAKVVDTSDAAPLAQTLGAQDTDIVSLFDNLELQ